MPVKTGHFCLTCNVNKKVNVQDTARIDVAYTDSVVSSCASRKAETEMGPFIIVQCSGELSTFTCLCVGLISFTLLARSAV